MDKGLFSNASQEVLIAKLGELLKDQKPALVLIVKLLAKGIFLYADDVIAEQKLPQELTDKSQAFFDAILVTKDLDQALVLGLDLATILYDFFKPKPTPAVTDGK